MAKLGDPRPDVLTVDGMAFCYVPAGPFTMGEGKELHLCDLDYGYWMGRYPVTNAQYAAFVAAGGYKEAGYWPEAAAAGYWRQGEFKGRIDSTWRRGPFAVGEPHNLSNHPVVGVSWYEALAFVRWLSGHARQWLPAGWAVRLPSEAEWEKAARGGEEIPVSAVIRPLGAGLAAAPGGAAGEPGVTAYVPVGGRDHAREGQLRRHRNWRDQRGRLFSVGCESVRCGRVERQRVGVDAQLVGEGYPYPSDAQARARCENLAAGPDEMRVIGVLRIMVIEQAFGVLIATGSTRTTSSGTTGFVWWCPHYDSER
ncbi:SUMF1/EgtB/PvdO family nonheme iron enzyme [Candidatus Amarolinea dominans]|uniref:formylglycine-generating enzyme family protein n=1 Tax=Candidatus Amarolinea dominans TaxID=3140696 RepID=UPI001D809B44|nr:SUMF1/EgtB/PvdO family nonheme iron enzyme [Anaerolineae bacterium]